MCAMEIYNPGSITLASYSHIRGLYNEGMPDKRVIALATVRYSTTTNTK